MDISYNPNLPIPDSDSDTLHKSQSLEQRLEASQARVCCLLETFPQVVWLAQANGSVNHFNSRWYEYTGLTVAESLNWAFLQAIHPEDRDRLHQSFAASIATNDLTASAPLDHKTMDTDLGSIGVDGGARGQKVRSLNVTSYECRIQGTDGTYRWFIGQVTPVRGEQGEILEWIGTYTPSPSINKYAAVPWHKSRRVPWVKPSPLKYLDQPLECLTNQIYEQGERNSSFSLFHCLPHRDEVDSASTADVRAENTQVRQSLKKDGSPCPVDERKAEDRGQKAERIYPGADDKSHLATAREQGFQVAAQVQEKHKSFCEQNFVPSASLLGALSASTQLAVGNQQPAQLGLKGQVANSMENQAAQQHLRQLISKLSQAIVWEAEATTNQFTFVSQSAERVLGYPVQQWLNDPDFWMSLIHPEDREWTVALCHKQRVQGRDYELVYRCRRADNRVIWLRDRAFVVRDKQGRIHKRRGLMVDITPIKQAEIEASSEQMNGEGGKGIQGDSDSPQFPFSFNISPFKSEEAIPPQPEPVSAADGQRPTDGEASEPRAFQSRIDYLSTIAQLTQQAISATSMATLMNNAVSLVSQTLQVEYGQVLEFLPDGNVLKLIAGVGWREGLVGNAFIDANVNTQAGYTLQTRQPVVIEDLNNESRFENSPLLHDHNIISGVSVIIPEASSANVRKRGDTQTRGQEAQKEGFTSISPQLPSSSPLEAAVSPGSKTTRPFGVLAAYTSRQRVFTHSDLDFLQSVAHILTAAIQYQQSHADLYQVQAQLAQTTVALEKCTREFDEFAYIASHDLKAPLRAIANLSQWIEEDICYQLNEENLHQLQLLRGRVHRLEILVEGLLQYSRAGRLKGEPESVDVTTLLRHILDTLNPPSEFTCEILPEMPVLVTQRLPLEQVFTHLINNAIQHHPASTGTVKISVQEKPEVYEFAVTDNGVGIASQFHQRVFDIFQTLGTQNREENAGVGLAIAKKIVEGKGGTIRLESREGWGATFYFTWPKHLSQV